jgi:hypothetical protein
VRLFLGEDLNFGLMLGSCIMKMPLLMTRSLSGCFGHKIDNEIEPCTTFDRYGPLRILAITKNEDSF